jgi:DNA-binding NarL/FixJ family response regulator
MQQVAETLRAAAAGETDLSPSLAQSMLSELATAEAAPEAAVLSRREAEVLQLFAEGCATTEVATKLFISAKTVKNHLASIYEKLDARDRTQAVLTAVRMGIVRLG